MKLLLTPIMYVGLLAGFFPLLNRIMFELTSLMGSPTVIAGLGWTMDVPVIGWWPVQVALTCVGFGAAHLLNRDKVSVEPSDTLPF